MISDKFLLGIFLGFFLNPTFGQVKPTVQPLPPTTNTQKTPASKNPTDVATSTSKKLQKALGLSDNQKGEIYKAVYHYSSETQKIQKSSLSNGEKYKKTRALDAEKTQKYQKILTKKQYNDYVMTFP